MTREKKERILKLGRKLDSIDKRLDAIITEMDELYKERNATWREWDEARKGVKG